MRFYDATSTRFLSLDPASEKYYTLSSYSYCASNPIMFTDPRGDTIKWDKNMSAKEINYVKSALKQFFGSENYSKVMNTLENSDFIYTVNNTTISSGDFGDFLGAYGSRITLTDEEGETKTMDISALSPQGRIGINFWLMGSDLYNQEEWVQKMAPSVMEEFVHAAQYDYYVHKYGQVDGAQADVNTEFEAKALVGLIQSETNKTFSISKGNRIPNSYGQNAKSGFSTKSYFSQMSTWHKHPDTAKEYRDKSMNSAPPGLLLLHLKK